MDSPLRNTWNSFLKFLAWEADRLYRCRECDGRVDLFEKTCPHCGAGDATRIPLTASAALLGIPVALGLVYFGLRWLF